MVYKTVEEAMRAKLDLVEHIQLIEVQLAERAAKVSVGRVPDEEYKDYLGWKARACRAKAVMVNKLSRTKSEIQRMRAEAAKNRLVRTGGENGLLTDLYGLTKSLVASGADITNEEQNLLDDIGSYLSNQT